MHGCIIYDFTYQDRENMADILQTTFSNAFPLLKICSLGGNFRWSLILESQLTISVGSGNSFQGCLAEREHQRVKCVFFMAPSWYREEIYAVRLTLISLRISIGVEYIIGFELIQKQGHHITVTSHNPHAVPKSPASRLVVQPFV